MIPENEWEVKYLNLIKIYQRLLVHSVQQQDTIKTQEQQIEVLQDTVSKLLAHNDRALVAKFGDVMGV